MFEGMDEDETAGDEFDDQSDYSALDNMDEELIGSDTQQDVRSAEDFLEDSVQGNNYEKQKGTFINHLRRQLAQNIPSTMRDEIFIIQDWCHHHHPVHLPYTQFNCIKYQKFICLEYSLNVCPECSVVDCNSE